MTKRSLHTPVQALSFFSLVLVLITATDQLSKSWARTALSYGKPQEFIPSIMHFELSFNTGAAFSIGQGAGIFFIISAFVIAALCLVLCVRTAKSKLGLPPLLALGLALVAAGGISNAIDRIIFAQVTDFFATSFIDFPIFNVADCAITIGVILSFVCWTLYTRKLDALTQEQASVAQEQQAHKEQYFHVEHKR